MAHIFKHPTPAAKGILVFTHKEIRSFFKQHPYFHAAPSGLSKLKNQVLNVGAKPSLEPDAILGKINQRYHIGVHFGWHHEDYPTLKHVDFYLAGPSTITFADQNDVFFIPLSSRSFVNPCFEIEKPKEHPKIWDIIMVARDARWKNLDKFLASVRKLYDLGHHLKVLLIVPSHPNAEIDRDSTRIYTELMEDYERLFSYNERGDFTIIKTHPSMPFLGMSQIQLAKFYHLSKVFTLFSEKEGGSRVISEALLSGLGVVVKSDLEGGGLDYLTDENSLRFNDFETAHETLLQAVKQWTALNNDRTQVHNNTSSAASIVQLKSYFDKLYTSKGEQFDGELINTDWVNFRLSSHWHEGLPWANRTFKNADVTTPEQLDLLINALDL